MINMISGPFGLGVGTGLRHVVGAAITRFDRVDAATERGQGNAIFDVQRLLHAQMAA